MEIDIRNNTDTEITEIRFSNRDVITKGAEWKGIEFRDIGGSKYSIYLSDIDNLIFALQKAKELWEDK